MESNVNVMDGTSTRTWNGMERRNAWDCRDCAAISNKDEARADREVSLVVDVLGTTVAIGLGVAVFYATGLANSEPGWVRSLIGFATVFWTVGMVRLGLRGE